mgnify:CR=1 FL=1
MRKKFWLIIGISFLLAGCSVTRSNVKEPASKQLDDAVTAEICSSVNINKGLISYYLEPSIGRISGNKSNSVFKIDGYEVVLNIDVSSVITTKYYGGGTNEQDFRDIDAFPNQIDEVTGSFLSGSGIIKDFRYRLYRVSDNEYGILLQTSNLIMVGKTGRGDVLDVIRKMMSILRTCRVDEEKIISTYSKKELINYKKETLDIFQKTYPENGSLQDMISDSSN